MTEHIKNTGYMLMWHVMASIVSLFKKIDKKIVSEEIKKSKDPSRSKVLSCPKDM